MSNDNSQERLPIKVIFTNDSDLSQPKPSGGKAKIFEEVTPTLRTKFVKQINNVSHYFSDLFAIRPDASAVAVVKLKPNAIAKTHRPRNLFSIASCPIIGGECFGSLLVRISQDGLKHLSYLIEEKTSNQLIAEISTLESISPYKSFLPDDFDYQKGIYKLQLFNFGDEHINNEMDNNFKILLEKLGITEYCNLNYSKTQTLYQISCSDSNKIKTLSKFEGTQKITTLTEFDVEEQSVIIGKISSNEFPLPEDREYPIVGLIDSGISPDNIFLSPWIIDRDEEDVPRIDQDNSHATFIAGLIVNGKSFNHDNPIFPDNRAKIIDVVAIPKGGTNEVALLNTIKRAIKKYPKVKVWNLSVNTRNTPCQDGSFSSFAVALDELQKEHNITFINSAGNHTNLRTWPPTQSLGELDRITPPADTALGITVGSIAHLEHTNSVVKKDSPSPFSRRGPGASFLPKPEISHYGGNLDNNGQYTQLGIISISPDGNLVENVGTSFSAPWVSVLMAELRHKNMSANMSKALLIHSAVLRGANISADEFKYKGFGIPQNVDYISTCQPWNATMIFEPTLIKDKRRFDRSGFPLPACLKRENGKYKGNIYVTLVYDPILLPSAGAEYCQVNVDVSIGRRREDKKDPSKITHNGQIKLQPENVKNLFESSQLEYGFKWSPVKVYKSSFSELDGDCEWGLRLEVHYRGYDRVEPIPQNVALIVTIEDPDRNQPVYNEVVRLLNQRGWASENLDLTTRIRTTSKI